MVFEFLFAGTTFLFLWITVGYPIVLLFVSRLSARPPRITGELPTLAVVVPTYQAEKFIRSKLVELARSDYPVDKLEIIVVDSASSDDTIRIAEELTGPRVKIVREAQRLGKGAALAAAARATEAEIILATDVDSTFGPDVPRKMAQYFSDPSVGIVSAARILPAVNVDGPGGASDVYWRYDSFLKRHESRLFSAVGAIGEAMAFRRDTLMASDSTKKMIEGGADDTVLSYETLRRGMRIILAEDVEVCEGEYSEALPFLNHKRRVIHQNMLNLIQFSDVLMGTHPWYSLFIIPSRRVIPLLMPFCYALNFIASTVLAAGGLPIAKVFLALHLLLLGSAAAAYVPGLSRIRFFQLCNMVLVMNAAIVAAAGDVLKNRRYSTWPILSSKQVAP